MSIMEGGCACGAIRFRVTQPFFAAAACHCRDCQHSTGGGPAYVGLAAKGTFEVTKGEAKVFMSKGDSGADVGRAFCPDCGSPLYSVPASAPFVPVKLGALDDPSAARIGIHIYMDSAQPWHVKDPALPAFPKGPPGA